MDHEKYMKAALREAKKAEQLGEVPIGAVIVKDRQIVGRGYNRRELDNDPTAHAEMIAIREASERLDSWRLNDCDLYVTLEPCPMCAGAIIQARLDTVVFGTEDPKAGSAGTLLNILQDERFNHQTVLIPGVLKEECRTILTSFFQALRRRKKEQKQNKING